MSEHDSHAKDLKIWQLVLNTAREVGKEVFTATDIANKIHETKPNVPATSIRTYVIAMAPKHPSYHHYPIHHPYFEFLGDGKYMLLKETGSPTPQENTIRMPDISKNSKDSFLEKYGNKIALWTKENQNALISGRKNYRWKDKSLIESLEKRNHLSKLIVSSRIRNNGGVDRATLDSIMEWGFPKDPLFPERDSNKCLEITREAFTLLDEGKPPEAICKLLSISHVGISRASKIIGLFDQNYFAIYDSRVGLALGNLKDGSDRIIKIPPRRPQPGKIYPSDNCTLDEWGKNYEKLLWVLEVIRNELNEQGYPFSIADVEMALFMMGE